MSRPVPPLSRRLVAEFVGTAFLLMAVLGSGIMAAALSPDDVGLQLLQNTIATGAMLTVLILMLQRISASFNPVVTLADAALGNVPWREVPVLIATQVAGGIGGAILANLMFDLPAVHWSAKDRSAGHLWLAEVVATVGLLLAIFVTARVGRADRVAFTVGGFITAAYWFTSSTSFANPAVTISRMFSDTFAGIAPASAPMFVLMQGVGLLVALALIRVLVPVAAPVPEGGVLTTTASQLPGTPTAEKEPR
ncbi:aquaporin [Nocardioides limicola]|uniref:aquaporin n=1 Tax=Nocardioides limicola TaxID=2803368 RepID=UPI00193B77B4|nr:MIP/aquaporin family protein [Nocardioides sp. DJM-14]